MKRIAIVDDENQARKHISSMIEEYGNQHGMNFDLRVFHSAIEFLTDYRPEYDIVFMDVEMPYMDGMSASTILRRLDRAVMLVFITNKVQYAIKGYEVAAFDYIVKPLSQTMFFRKFSRMLENCKESSPVYVYVRTGGVNMRLELNEISYIEVHGHNVIYHTDRGEINVRDSLASMEERYKELPLVRCNNCYIVNLRYVESVGKDTVLVAGTKLAVSRSRKKEFMRRLAQYLGE